MTTAQLLDQFGKPIVRKAAQTALSGRKRVQARYDAAQTSTENQNHWANSDSLSASSANSPAVRQKLRDRARYEFANNTYCGGMVKTLTNDVIGTGPRLQMQSGNEEQDAAVEMAFWKWTVATNFAQKLRTMWMAKVRDGEAFGVFSTNYNLKNPVKLDILLFEADQIATPWDSRYTSDSDADGIIFDDFGNPAAYTLLNRHPGSTTFTNWNLESELLAARDVMHLFRRDRPGQIRGIPEYTAALPLYAQLRRYTLAVIAAAETAADIAGFIQSTTTVEDPDDIEPLDILDIQRRMLMTLPKGWSIEQLRAEQPCTNYSMFKREIINEIARILCMPYNIAAGDSSAYNFASGRLDHKTYYKQVRVDRSGCEIDCVDVALLRWWEEARGIPDVLPAPLRQLREPPRHTWGWDGDEHIDPLKEANAQAARLKNGTTTYAREFGADGRDWEDEFRQRAKEKALMESLGLTFEDVAPAAQPAIDEAQAEAIAERVLEMMQ